MTLAFTFNDAVVPVSVMDAASFIMSVQTPPELCHTPTLNSIGGPADDFGTRARKVGF